MKNKFRLELKGGYVRIFINGILHLMVEQNKVTGIMSWIENKKWYAITLYTADGNIVCKYDTKEKWQAVLKLLNESFI